MTRITDNDESRPQIDRQPVIANILSNRTRGPVLMIDRFSENTGLYPEVGSDVDRLSRC